MLCSAQSVSLRERAAAQMSAAGNGAALLGSCLSGTLAVQVLLIKNMRFLLISMTWNQSQKALEQCVHHRACVGAVKARLSHNKSEHCLRMPPRAATAAGQRECSLPSTTRSISRSQKVQRLATPLWVCQSALDGSACAHFRHGLALYSSQYLQFSTAEGATSCLKTLFGIESGPGPTHKKGQLLERANHGATTWVGFFC